MESGVSETEESDKCKYYWNTIEMRAVILADMLGLI